MFNTKYAAATRVTHLFYKRLKHDYANALVELPCTRRVINDCSCSIITRGGVRKPFRYVPMYTHIIIYGLYSRYVYIYV